MLTPFVDRTLLFPYSFLTLQNASVSSLPTLQYSPSHRPHITTMQHLYNPNGHRLRLLFRNSRHCPPSYFNLELFPLSNSIISISPYLSPTPPLHHQLIPYSDRPNLNFNNHPSSNLQLSRQSHRIQFITNSISVDPRNKQSRRSTTWDIY